MKIAWKLAVLVCACVCVDVFALQIGHRRWSLFAIITANLLLLTVGGRWLLQLVLYKPARPANYPRLKHLRIAGKYDYTQHTAETEGPPPHLNKPK